MSIKNRMILEIDDLRSQAAHLMEKARLIEEQVDLLPHDIEDLTYEEFHKFQEWFESVV